MKTIALVQQKGGAGKTTICDQLAYNLEEDGYKVEVADLDDQGSSNFQPKVALDEDEEPDFTIVDTRGALDMAIEMNGEAITISDVIESSDLVVIPTLCEEDCRLPLERVVTLCEAAKVDYLIVFNRVDMRRVVDQLIFQDFCTKYPGHVSKNSIRQGSGVSKARLLKCSIMAVDPKCNPAQDMRKLTDEVKEALNG